ncbi:MAG: 16S rRNA (guanine(966)-N(2))-methyltransferase RsmD [Rhodospirillales bacterium]|nr:16S rRNA (guanine(966)-N(2))-methyltransferase RsmD [Rhodospirillales bacterium]MBO6788563.1 16S rRNA (guanine(966)-N(2))-methyltransferase RsmD [Rhodospirillales bacterium]
MRIVSGKFKGRRLVAPESWDIRPTSDRARESIFNIIEHAPFAPEIEGASAIDVFAGTGALGLEAMSRGATPVTFIDLDDVARATILKNAGTMGQGRAVTVLRLDATKMPPPPRIAQCPATYAFLDAPYDQDVSGPALLSMLSRGWIAKGSLCVVETPTERSFDAPRGFTMEDQRKYGRATVSFLSVE